MYTQLPFQPDRQQSNNATTSIKSIAVFIKFIITITFIVIFVQIIKNGNRQFVQESSNK